MSHRKHHDRRKVIRGIGLLGLNTVFFGSSSILHSPKIIKAVTTTSCTLEDQPQPLWDVIRKNGTDLHIDAGDRIYADTRNVEKIIRKYDRAYHEKHYRKFRKKIPVTGVPDDHDFADNDCSGADLPHEFKCASKRAMLHFYREPKDSPRWTRDGMYTSLLIGERPRLYQAIILDLRWWKTPLQIDVEGSYIPDPKGVLLGEEQWEWLEERLKIPVDIRHLVSSTQLVSSAHPFEKWANYPNEKKRLYRLIDRLKVRNIFATSGDMHYAEHSAEDTPGGYKMHDFTASGVNRYEEIADEIPNSKRLGIYDQGPNYNKIMFETDHDGIRVKARSKNHKGKSVLKTNFLLYR